MSATTVSRPTDQKILEHNEKCAPFMNWEWVTPPNDDCKRCLGRLGRSCGIIVNVEHPMDWQSEVEAW